MYDNEVIVNIEENILSYLGHKKSVGELFELQNGWRVSASFYTKAIREVLSVLGGMDPTIYYTARELCGDDYWNSISKWNRNITGLCVADAVKRGWLPFTFKPQRRSDRSTRRYRINPNNAMPNREED